MRSNIRLWSIDESLENATELTEDKWTESEEVLEELLVRNPEVLMPGLNLIARQAPTGSGVLDLLGIDVNGRMIVFELKKGKSARDSVAQIIDYTSFLDSLGEESIANYLAEHSGGNFIEKIDDFENWYEERYVNSEVKLRPARMMLVSFDVDIATQRMVEFLNERGVAIEIQTLSKYEGENEILLVSHHDKSMNAKIGTKKVEPSDEEKIGALSARADKLGVGIYWKSVVNALDIGNFSIAPKKLGITFWRKGNMKLSEEGGVFRAAYSVLLEDNGEVKVTFFPVSVDLCFDSFKNSSVPFKQEQSPNAPTTEEVKYQSYCIFDEKRWDIHKEEVSRLAADVSSAWETQLKRPDTL